MKSLEVNLSLAYFAGLVCFTFGDVAMHFAMRRGHRRWGIVRDWYDGPQVTIGVGPFALVCIDGNTADLITTALVACGAKEAW